MKKDYIILSGKIFYYTTNDMKISSIGTGVQRSLNATAYQDTIANKRSWSIVLEGDASFYLRILSIYNTGGDISFTDSDGSSYTVLWSGDFTPVDDSTPNKEHYSVAFMLQQK